MSDDTKDQITNHDSFLKAAASEVDRQADHGLPVSVDPDVAEFMGAFEENALNAEDALDSIHVEGEVEYHG